MFFSILLHVIRIIGCLHMKKMGYVISMPSKTMLMKEFEGLDQL
jgi:hypothetical protein